jgi:hypothetical protein
LGAEEQEEASRGSIAFVAAVAMDADLDAADPLPLPSPVSKPLTPFLLSSGSALSTLLSSLLVSVPVSIPGMSVTRIECVSAPGGVEVKYRSRSATASRENLRSSQSVARVTAQTEAACTHSVGDQSLTLAMVALSMSVRGTVVTAAVSSRSSTKRAISSSV